MAAVMVFSDFGLQEIKICHCFHFLPIYLPWKDGIGCHDLRFFNLSFKPALSLSFFTLIKRLLTSSLLSAIRVVSSAYLRLLIFLPAVLISACDSSSQDFTWGTLHRSQISRVTIYRFDVLLSQFWINLSFHLQFYLLLLVLHTGFSGDRLGLLVFPPLQEFSVCCYPWL